MSWRYIPRDGTRSNMGAFSARRCFLVAGHPALAEPATVATVDDDLYLLLADLQNTALSAAF
jgi:hypothetical protein